MFNVYHTKGEPISILDPNDQKAYWDFAKIDFDMLAAHKKGTYRIVSNDHKKYFQIIFDNFKHGFVLAEEADQYLKAQKDEALFQILTALRHVEHDLDFASVFHSIQYTPDYVINNCNEMILFKTGDNWSKVRDKFPTNKIEEAERIFNEVNKHPDPFYWDRIIINKTGTK